MRAPRGLLGLQLLLLLLRAPQTAGRAKGRPSEGEGDAGRGGGGGPDEERSCADVVGASAPDCVRTELQGLPLDEVRAACDDAMGGFTAESVVKRLADAKCAYQFNLTHTEAGCESAAPLWATSTPSVMCEFFAGDEQREWEDDCAAASAFKSAAVSALGSSGCEASAKDSVQEVIDELYTACADAVYGTAGHGAWAVARCAPLSNATCASAPINSSTCPEGCDRVDPQEVRTLVNSLVAAGCNASSTPAKECPAACQARIDGYYDKCSDLSMWEDWKLENKRLAAAIGCGASGRVAPALAAAAALALLAVR